MAAMWSTKAPSFQGVLKNFLMLPKLDKETRIVLNFAVKIDLQNI